jgi:hypothetical protein
LRICRGGFRGGESGGIAHEPAPSSPPGRSLAERLSLLPLAIGLFVGILYTVGAVLTTGQLRRANLVVRDTLPLVPLPQLLGRGMSVFLKPFAGVLGIALVFVAVVVLGGEIERMLERHTTGWATARRRGARGIVVLVGVAALVLLSPPPVAIGIAACSLVMLLWVRSLLPLRTSLLLFAGVTALMLLALAFYRPEPLATVTIQTMSRGTVRGDLITSAAGTWYVGLRHRNFTTVGSSEIRSIEVCSGPHSSRPIFRRILDAIKGSVRARAAARSPAGRRARCAQQARAPCCPLG